MTRITLTPAHKDEYGFARLTVNGKYLGIPGRITEIKKVKPGRWEGVASGEPFYIEGGLESGGGRNDWFFGWEPLTGVPTEGDSINFPNPGYHFCNGPAQAITAIETS